LSRASYEPGDAFATCTSPTQLTGLGAGSHTISVRGVDNAGNVGDADTKAFTVDSPPADGATGAVPQPSEGSSTAAITDKTAPKVSVVARSSRASKKGTVSFRVGCPKAETSCKVTVQLKRGSRAVARKTVTVKGGKTVTVTLTLSKAARLQLTKHRTLKLSTAATATDTAGNRRTTTRSLTVRAPSA
jgi:exo-beta-1,3-glucanase (GH17 family)